MACRKWSGRALFLGLITTILPLAIFAQEAIPAGKSNAEKVYTTVSNSIYLVKSFELGAKETFQGSAVAVDNDVLATNCHVALAGNILVVYLPDRKATGLLFYNKGDLCLITVAGAQFKPVKIRPSEDVKIGEEVYAVGNPEGFEKTISNGIISNKYEKDGFTLLQTTATISPGSSGGGLFDNGGNLIGITFLKDEEKGAEGLGFAIPTEMILDVIGENRQPSSQPVSRSGQQNFSASNTQNSTNVNVPHELSSPVLIGHYGLSNIGLYRWNNGCLMTIRGQHQPGEIVSLAVWFPDNPNGFFVFPSTVKINDVVRILNQFHANGEPSYIKSKDYVFLENHLYSLSSAIDKNGDLLPALVFAINKNLTEQLVDADYFLVQLHQYKGVPGVTTIRFNLDGFTEALGVYNNTCGR